MTVMSAALLGTYESSPAPGGVRALRTTLVVTAVLAVVTALASLSLAPVTPDRVGEAVWGLLPGVAAFLLFRRAASGRSRVVAGVVGLAVVMLLLALVRVAAGEVQGLTNLLLPTLLIVLVARRDARSHLRHGVTARDSGATGSRTPRRRALLRRSRAGDGGQLTVEAIGVLAVAALVIGLGTAAVMSAPVQDTLEDGTEEIVCTIQDSTGCGYAAPGSGDGGRGGGGGDDADDGGCSGFWACAGSVLGQVGSLVYQVVDAAIDDVVGIFELVMDPSRILDALRYLFTHPGEALLALFWDVETQALWAAGDYGGAMGRLVWNVGSMFIPFANVAKVAASLGDVGRLSGIAASADELADLAAAGQRAQDAARLGNLDEAARIAVDARRQADELAERSRAAGCLAAGTVTLQVLAAGPARGAASVNVVAGGICDAAGDAARQADEAADAAAVAASAGRPRPSGVTGPGGEDLAVVPEGGVGRLADNAKGLVYDVRPGTRGLDPRVIRVRVMDPTTRYPNGYVSYENASGQTIDPVTGRTVAPGDPYWHIEMEPPR